MASRWLPDNEEFFESLLRLIETSEAQANSASYDASEFFFRRLDAYERTLSTLKSRVAESLGWDSSTRAPDDPAPEVINQLSYILQRTSALREHYQGIFFLSLEREQEDTNEQPVGLLTSRFPGDGPGRPRFSVSREQLEALNGLSGFCWSEIARTFGVSERTLRRRRHELGMAVEGRQFSDLSDDELDNHIRSIISITPNAGLRMMQGALRHRGFVLQRDRVLRSMHRVDPVTSTLRNTRRIIRRTYNVPCPNALWHIDGNHKLIQYRIVIHGGIDGYSRLLVFLAASNNNRASTVLDCFQQAVAEHNLPSRVRSDLGMENLEVGRFMLDQRGLNRGSIITGTSVHNQRIERLWRDMNRIVVSKFLNIFLFLESHSVLDPLNEVHLLCLHLVYIDEINETLQEFMAEWNNHPVTTECNLSPRQLWVHGMVSLRNSGYTAVDDVVNNTHYGVDEEGPVPEEDPSQMVCVPESSVHLNEQQLACVESAIAATRATGDAHGITSFLVAVEQVTSITDTS